ncbi:unnamed protein product [Nyctereutes procyonoides]|uniref:(raccoon dog) hypothetical protein n=1 Tax=Nyctereutes procyonoides TaxID=34880 RepID=A0A811ZIZ4_NYCPR|nr:unnamed protein product [Nyctereutes procyonoides]
MLRESKHFSTCRSCRNSNPSKKKKKKEKKRKEIQTLVNKLHISQLHFTDKLIIENQEKPRTWGATTSHH